MKDEGVYFFPHPSSLRRDYIVPAFVKSFDSYKIYHFSGTLPLLARRVAIWIPCFKASRQVGALNFMADPADVQDNRYQNDQIMLFYHIDRFNEIVATLRYESPLSLMLNIDSSEDALITKEFEPVGEEEAS
jgi:hypothetical protein